jgi:predicted phosphodiesterase
MTRIGLLSDTHGYLPPQVFEHFKEVDEIWHAGDIGTVEVAEKLEQFKGAFTAWASWDGEKVPTEG